MLTVFESRTKFDNCCLSDSATFDQKKNTNSVETTDVNDFSFGIDTVRFRFLITDERLKKYTRYVVSDTLEKDIESQDNYCRTKRCVNIYNQPFAATTEQTEIENPEWKIFVEFSLPKFIYKSNLFKTFWTELINYYTSHVKPYSIEDTCSLNRIDFGINYEFESVSDLNSFEKFLRGLTIGNSSLKSSEDFCFWKMNDRVVRFYKKGEEIKNVDRKSLKEFQTVEEFLTWEAHYRQMTSFCDDRVGRLEFQFKRDWLYKKFKTVQFEKLIDHLITYDWFSQFKKDFSFLRDKKFEVKVSRSKDVIERLKSHKTKHRIKFLEYLYYSMSTSKEDAEDVYFGNNTRRKKYWYRIFKDITGFSVDQALSGDLTCVNFPDKIVFLNEFRPVKIKKDKEYWRLFDVLQKHLNIKRLKKRKQKLRRSSGSEMRRC